MNDNKILKKWMFWESSSTIVLYALLIFSIAIRQIQTWSLSKTDQTKIIKVLIVCQIIFLVIVIVCDIRRMWLKWKYIKEALSKNKDESTGKLFDNTDSVNATLEKITDSSDDEYQIGGAKNDKRIDKTIGQIINEDDSVFDKMPSIEDLCSEEYKKYNFILSLMAIISLIIVLTKFVGGLTTQGIVIFVIISIIGAVGAVINYVLEMKNLKNNKN